MIKLFIADDELLVLMGIRVIADWEANGMEIVGEARDGKSALSLIMETAPDVVITDLNMPVMDGIELIKRLKQTGYQGQIVVLSNYNELQMVKEAIKAGAADYVLKVTLNGNELVELVRSLAGVSERTAGDGEQLRRNSLALEWLHGDIDAAELRARIERFRLRIGERNRLIAASALRGERGVPDDETLRNILLEVVNRKTAAEALTLGAGRCLLVFPVETGDEPESALREIGEDIRMLIRRYLNLDMQLIYQQQPVAWERMGEEVRHLAVGLDSEFYELCPGVRRMDEIAVTLDLEEAFWHLKQRLRDQLELGEDVSPLLDELFRHIEDKRYGMKAVRQIGRNLHTLAEEVLRSAGGELDAAVDSEAADGFDSASDFAAYSSRIEQLFERVHAGLAQLRSGRKRDEIRKAIAYIKQNYRSKITLEDLSNHVNLNKNYFSTLFKQETDLSPVEYIIQYKMEKARELLLSGQANVSVVSHDLGYDDLSYFSRLFKKHFGVSPGSIARKS
ncbi:response regulator [Cohnella hongkongensis]|uniref:Response regulator n=1 Tax=Cohnella hongkongensis TaxID=178337 RepID=A0ABV9F967_9BACL